MKPFILAALIVFALLFAGAPMPARAQTNNPGAVTLDGTNGFIQMPSGVWFNGDFTVEGWVYVRSYQAWSRLIDFADGPGTNNVYFALTSGTGGLPTSGVFTNNNGAPVVSSTSQLPTGQWVHLAETLHGTTGTIYINGNVVGNGVLNVAPNVVRSNNYVGRSAYASDSYADAIFDELRIWNVARSQFQLQTFKSQPLLGPQTNLVGYWRFDDNTGTQAGDSSGNNNPGTLQGGTTWTNFTAPISPGFGTALDFNGTNQIVGIPNQAAFNTLPLTVMTWFKAPTNSLGAALVNKYSSGSHNGYQIFMLGGHLVAWYYRDTADVVGTLDAGFVNDGQWHHTAFVVDANGGQLYLDGVLKSSQAWTGTPGPTTSTFGISLGIYQGNSFWKGQLDEVSFWNAALSPSQIHSAAVQGLTGTESDLLAYYRLDEGGGLFIADSSTNHFNGTNAPNPTWVASFPPLTYSAQTISATPLFNFSELLTGSVIPVGLDTAAWFQFGPSTNYGSVTASTNWTDGFLPQRIVSMVVTGLLENTDYHYQLVCSNSAGIRVGADQVFHSTRNIFITSLADSGDGSLRQALATAHDSDTIYLTNGTFVLTGGELAVSNTVSIVGISPSATVVSGNNASRVFDILSATANVTLSFMTIENGRAPNNSLDGGGIYNLGTLTIDHCILTNNQAGSGTNANGDAIAAVGGGGGNGGGIWNGGTLFVSKSTLVNNSGGKGGKGGIGFFLGFPFNSYTDPGHGGSGGSGGAIMNFGTATFNECTLFTNTGGQGGIGGDQSGHNGGTGGSGGTGGAIFNNGTLTVIASTLVQNTAGNGGAGGSGSPTGTNGSAGAVGGIDTPSGSATLQNTAVAQNSGAAFNDVTGIINSTGHNFLGQNNGATGFTNGVNGDLAGSKGAPLNPQLAPLGNYGGVTPTCQLLPGSPLKDAGDDTLLNPPYFLTNDQSDLPRLVGSHVDIGAVESQNTNSPQPTAVTLPVTPTPTQDPVHISWMATLEGSVNPSGLTTTVFFQFGITANYSLTLPAGVLSFTNASDVLVNATITNLANGLTYHYRVVATNSAGIVFGGDKSFQTIAIPVVPGDINGDGVVDSSELATIITHLHTNGVVLPADLALVLSNYWLNASAIRMTNVAGLQTPLVTFGLTNYAGENFSVEYSTNLIDWVPLGSTSPRFQFTDTNSPAVQRYYRLRWP
jgi:hypothetical protein